MPIDLLYKEEKLVAIYDSINKWGDDNDFYLNQAGNKPLKILDAGCGTGILAIELAKKGHKVTGIDPSEKMIEYAQSKEYANKVKWVVSSLEEYRNSESFDLIIMAGHAFQCLVADKEIKAAFISVSNLLGKKGKFIFETRNPLTKPWENWNPLESRKRFKLSDSEFELFHKLNSVKDEIVTFETIYKFCDHPELISESTLRFASIDTISEIINKTGLTINSLYGNWDMSGYEENSREIISIISK